MILTYHSLKFYKCMCHAVVLCRSVWPSDSPDCSFLHRLQSSSHSCTTDNWCGSQWWYLLRIQGEPSGYLTTFCWNPHEFHKLPCQLCWSSCPHGCRLHHRQTCKLRIADWDYGNHAEQYVHTAVFTHHTFFVQGVHTMASLWLSVQNH